MRNVQKSIEYFKKKLQQGVSKCRRRYYETAISVMQELQQYHRLEARLCDMFGGVITLETTVNELERCLTEPEKPHPTYARILTYEDAERYDRLREAEDAGLLLKLPCAVGDTVYEVFYDELNNPQYYICEYEVEDISTKAIKYAGDWVDLVDLRNTYFNREEAEERLREMAGIFGQSVLPIK